MMGHCVLKYTVFLTPATSRFERESSTANGGGSILRSYERVLRL
jgi:hypothetical protein